MSPSRIGVYGFAFVAIAVYAGIGALRVTSAPGHGTQVTGRVPVAQDLPSLQLVA